MTFQEPIITRAEFYKLKELTERAARLQEHMAGDGDLPIVGAVAQKSSVAYYEKAVHELDAFSQELEARGVTEEDIELRHNLIANPNYRPPYYLGDVGVELDEVEWDVEMER